MNEEMQAAQEEAQRKKQEEYAEKVKEYNQNLKLVPVKAIKSWSGSWVVLVLAIATTVTAFLSMISLFTTLSSGWFKILTCVVKLLLNVLLCVGFWRVFAMGRKKDDNLNSGGVKMLKGVITFYQVITYIVMILIITLFIVAFIGMVSCAKDVQDAANNANVDVSGVTAKFIGILVGILLVLIAVFVIFIIYYGKIIGFTKAVITCMDEKTVKYTGFKTAAVLFFIVGGVAVLQAIGPAILSGVLSGILNGLPSQLGFLSMLSGLFKIDVADLIAQIAKAATYIFAGVLVLQFNGLAEKVSSGVRALEKPVKPL